MTNRTPKPASDTAQPPTSLLDPRVVDAVAREAAGNQPCYCPDDWREDTPERREGCPSHGSGQWPDEGHCRQARAYLTAALAALDREALIDSAARAMGCEDGNASDLLVARHDAQRALVAIGLIPEAIAEEGHE